MTPAGALFVVVSGPPASGKSTLAPAVAAGLHLPLIAKDVIKDALVAALGAGDVEESRRLGTAAVRVMLAVAAHAPSGAVLESNLYRSAAESLADLPGSVVEVFCRCERSVAEARYRARAATERAGYFDSLRAPEELWNDEIARPADGGWPLLIVDTDRPVDVDAVVSWVRGAGGDRG